MLAHVPSFGRNPRGSPDFLAYPVPKACMHVPGTRVPRRLGVARSASSPKAAQALGCSLTPGLRISFGRVTCMARAASVPGLWALGFLLLCGVCFWVRLAVGCGFCYPVCPGWGLGWVCLGSICGVVPLVSAICGVRGWASVSVCFWDVCGFVGAPLAPRRFRFRRAVWACVPGPGLACAQSVLAGLSGCVFFFLLWFFLFFFFFFFLGFVVPVPPSPFFRAGLVALFFFFFFFFFFLSLFPVVRCYWLGVAGFGWVVRLCLCGGPPFFFFFFFFWGGGLAACGGVGGWLGGCGLFSCLFPFPPPFFFFLAGGLPVPPSAFPGLAHALACIQCCLPGCCFQLRSVWPCSGPMGRVGSVHCGLGAPSCWVRSWLCRLGGCARRLLVVLG